jgi:hypothetical protein
MQNIAEGGTPSPGGAADTPLALKESTEPQAADAVPPVKKKRTRKRR